MTTEELIAAHERRDDLKERLRLAEAQLAALRPVVDAAVAWQRTGEWDLSSAGVALAAAVRALPPEWQTTRKSQSDL